VGKLSLLLVASLAIVFSIHSYTIERRATAVVENYVRYNSKTIAQNINNSTMQLALRKMSDSSSWRSGYNQLAMFGGRSTLTLRDTTVAGKKCVSLHCLSVCDKDSQASTVIIQSKLIPPVVRGAITSFGRLDQTISDMYVDGRDHTEVVISVGPPAQYQLVPQSGYFGISTGAPDFVNIPPAYIGGTDRTTNPPTDIIPVFPDNPKTIEANAPWPNGFPTTPDAAMGWPEGTLKAIAMSGVNGSRYITSKTQMAALVSGGIPLEGVTYIDVSPTDTLWSGLKIPDNSGGIFVFHCPTKTAYWKNISFPTSNGTFKGLMIFDKIFHIHMNILGALVMLTPNTVMDQTCNGNADKTIAMSTNIIERNTAWMIPKTPGGWEKKLMLKSWFEE